MNLTQAYISRNSCTVVTAAIGRYAQVLGVFRRYDDAKNFVNNHFDTHIECQCYISLNVTWIKQHKECL